MSNDCEDTAEAPKTLRERLMDRKARYEERLINVNDALAKLDADESLTDTYAVLRAADRY